jgi:hypothetical protein
MRRAGPALASRSKGRRRAMKCEKGFSSFFSNNFQLTVFKSPLSKKLTSFENDPKIKVT